MQMRRSQCDRRICMPGFPYVLLIDIYQNAA
jgi:hypothetical protein